jgi:hypothetical protein
MSKYKVCTMVLTFLLMGSSTALAKDIFIAQNATGASDGSSCSNAYAVSFFNTAGNWGTGSNQIGPGTAVHLCGTFTGTAGSSMLTMQGSGAPGNPITIKFETDAVMQAPYWGENDGTNSTSGAITIANGTSRSYIIIDGGTNGVIKNTDSGTELTYKAITTGVYIGSGGSTDIEVKNLTIKDMYLRTAYISATGEKTSTCIRARMGAGNVRFKFHHLTLSDAQIPLTVSYNNGASDLEIYNNETYNHIIGIRVASSDTNDGQLTNLSVYNNNIHDWYKWWDTANAYHMNGMHIYAVHTNTYIDNISVYNNYIHGDWGQTIKPKDTYGNHITAWIFMEGGGGLGLTNGKYYNNVLVADHGDSPSTGFLGVYESMGAQIYNNTIIGMNGGGAIQFNKGGEIVKNNLIYNVSTYISFDNTIKNPAEVDYNLYYGGTTTRMFQTSSQVYVKNDFTGWKALGWDANGVVGNPNLSPAYHLTPGTIAVGKGINLTSLGITSLNADKEGKARPSTGPWAIGAFHQPRVLLPPGKVSGQQ